MGNNDQVFQLADGSFWEVKYEYEYFYEYYPDVIVCPKAGELIIDDKRLHISEVSGHAPAKDDRTPTVIESKLTATSTDGKEKR